MANTSESMFYARRKHLLANLPTSSSPQLFPHLPAPRTTLPSIPSQVSFSALVQSIPLQIGTVRILAKNPRAAKTILHIQDVHQNTEAQKNISAAVQSLLRTQDRPLIALEGTSEEIDLTAFHEFPMPGLVKDTAELLLLKNKISGPVHASYLTPQKATILQGVEDQKLYDENVAAYRNASASAKSASFEIKKLQKTVTAEKTTKWNSRLQAFDTEMEKYHNAQISLGQVVQLLDAHIASPTTNVELFLQASLLEDRIHFDEANRERAAVLNQLASKLSPSQISTLTKQSFAYRMGQISHGAFYSHLKDLCRQHHISLNQTPAFNDFLQYVVLADAINADTLFTELQQMENAAYGTLFESKAEENIYQKSRALYLASKLVDFSLTSNEWESYKQIASLPMVARISSLSSFEKFYEVAEKRNAVMVKNLYRSMEKNKTSFAILVTGGFHTLGIGRDLEKDGVTYASFTPRITHITDISGIEALSVFNQEKTPLDQLFEGQKLFLAQNPQAPSARREAAGRIAATALRAGSLRFSSIQTFFSRATGWSLLKFQKLIDGAVQLVWRNGNGQQSAAFYPNGRIQILNTTFVLAPILTAAHALILSTPLLSVNTLIAYLTYKVILSLSIIAHELAHLAADKELNRKNIFSTVKAVFSTTISGRDVNSAVAAKAQSRLQVKMIGLVGPLMNVGLVGVGIYLLSTNFFLGYSLVSANVLLIVLNALFSNDLRAAFTGLKPTYFGIASSGAATNPYDTEFEIALDDTAEGMARIADAKSAILRFHSDLNIPLTDVIKELAGEFVSNRLNKTLNRGIRSAKVIRRANAGRIVFSIQEITSLEDQLIEKSDSELEGLEKRASTLGCQIQMEKATPTSRYLIFSFSAPIQRTPQDRVQPSKPEQADDIDTLIQTPITGDRVEDIEYFLTSDPNAVDSNSLFYILEHPDLKSLSEKATQLLQDRLKQLSPTELSLLLDFLARATHNPENRYPVSLQVLSAVALTYILNRKDRLPKSVPTISFSDLPSQIENNERKKFQLITTPNINGRISIQVREKQNWFYALLSKWFKKNPKISKMEEGVLVFQIDRENTDDEIKANTPASASLNERLTTVWFQYRGTLSKDTLKMIIGQWSLGLPLNIPTTVKIKTDQIAPSKDAFLDNGFTVQSMETTHTTLSKVNQGPTTTVSGTVNSRLGGKRIPPGLYLFVPFIYFIELIDEIAAFVAIYVQGFQVNWTKTDLLRWNPHVNYFHDPDRPIGEAFISAAAPLVWGLILSTAIILWIHTPLLTSFDTVGSTTLTLTIWYLAAGSLLQLLFNFTGWQRFDRTSQKSADELTDVQRFVVQIKDYFWPPAKNAIQRLPTRAQIGGRVNSSLFKIGEPVRDFFKFILATVIAWIPGNAAASTAQRLLTPNLAESASADKTRLQAQKIYSDYEKALLRKFPEDVAAASHNYGYWIMEAQDKVNQNGLFIGSSLNILSEQELAEVLTVEGFSIYANRHENLDKPQLKSHVLTLKHFQQSAVEKFYAEKLGRPEIGRIAKDILAQLDGDKYVVVDLFARPWRSGESEQIALGAIQDSPLLKAAALRRQIPFTAMVMALHGTDSELGYSREDILKALWMFMKLIDFKEQESLDLQGSVTGDSFASRPKELWDRYRAQMNAVLDALPKVAGRINSRFGLHQLLYFDPPRSTPHTSPDATIENSNRPRITVIRRGGKGGGGPFNSPARKQFVANLLAAEKALSKSDGTNSQNDSDLANGTSASVNSEGQSTVTKALSDNKSGADFVRNNALSSDSKSASARIRSDSNTETNLDVTSLSNTVDKVARAQARADAQAQAPSASSFVRAWNSLLNRLTLRPLTWTPYLYGFVGVNGLSILGLAHLDAYGSPGLLIAQQSLTYLSYIVGVLFSLAFLGRKIIQPLSQGADVSYPSLLEKTFGLLTIADNSIPREKSGASSFSTRQADQNERSQSFVSRALVAMRAEGASAISNLATSKPALASPTIRKANTAATAKRTEAAMILQILVKTAYVLRQEVGQSPQATLQEISSLNASPNTIAVLTHLAKAQRQQSFLLATYRGAFSKDRTAERQAQALESLPPIEFLQFRRAALILRDELIAQMKEQRSRSERTQWNQVRLLQQRLSSPGFLDKVTLLLNSNQGSVATLLLNSSRRPGDVLRDQIETRNNETPDNLFSRIPENMSEADLALLSSIEAAVELLAQKRGSSKEMILQMIVEGKLSEMEMSLIKEFANTPFDNNIKKQTNKPIAKIDASALDAKVQSAARFLLSELRSPRNPQNGSSLAAERRLITATKSPQFASITARIAASLAIASSVAIASAASQVSTPVKNGLTATSLAAVNTLNPVSDVRATVTPAAMTRATPLLKPTEDTDSSDSLTLEESSYLEKLAEDFVNLAQAALGKKEASGKIDFNRVLPPVASHGVSNNNPALAMQLLTEEERADLEILIATKVQNLLDDRRLTSFEAQQLLINLLLNSEVALSMKDSIGNKDIGLPLEGGSEAQRANDVALVNSIRSNLKPSQKLILFVSPSDMSFFESIFEEAVTSERIKIIASAVVSTQGDKHVLDFNQLEAGLVNLNTDQLQNLVILLQDGLSWNSSKLDELRALGLVGFFFTRDFVSGVPAQRMDIQFIQKLAKQLSTHA